MHACMLSRFSHVQLFVTLWTVALQAPLSVGLSRQEYWSGWPCPPPGNLPDLGIEPTSLMSLSCIGRHVLKHSVQFSRSVASDSLWPHGLQHTRPPCPSPTPRIYSNSCPLSQWCHPTISSSVVPFSSCLQSFPASGSFPISQFFASGGQSIGVSASTSVFHWTFRTDLL